MAKTPKTRFEKAQWGRLPLTGRYRSGLLELPPNDKERWSRSRWLWLFPLLLVSALVLSGWYALTRVQSGIEEAARELLAREGIDTTNLDFDANWRDIEIEGALPDGTDIERLEQLLEDEVGLEDGGRLGAADINNATITATGAEPRVLGAIAVNAVSDGETITLTGNVLSQEHKDTLTEAAQGTGLMAIADELTVSGSEPQAEDADGQVAKLASVIGGLTAGSFVAADLSIDEGGPVMGTIEQATGADPEPLSAVAGQGVEVVTAAPETGSLDTEVDFDGTQIVLSGTVLTDGQSELLVESAAGVVGAENVVNNLEVSGLDESVEGADGRIDALRETIATFDGLSMAEATMNDLALTVNGVAVDGEARDATAAVVAAAEATGLRAGGEIALGETDVDTDDDAPSDEPSLAEEVELLAAELEALEDEIERNVVFHFQSFELTPTAERTLDKVAAVMNRYPGPVVEVGGHTDNQGTEVDNQWLSQRRAECVIAHLVKSVDPDRLNPVGFGESQPIGDNNTEAGRIQNRRVEFVVKERF